MKGSQLVQKLKGETHTQRQHGDLISLFPFFNLYHMGIGALYHHTMELPELIQLIFLQYVTVTHGQLDHAQTVTHGQYWLIKES
jgi:hypothetical protein